MSRPLLVLALTAGVTACTVGPDFSPPAAPETSAYTAEPVTLPADQRVTESEKLRADWGRCCNRPISTVPSNRR